MQVGVQVDYEVDDPVIPDKHFPITIKGVRLRGEDIYRLLHIGHIMTLQRAIHNRLLDEEFARNGLEQEDPTRFG